MIFWVAAVFLLPVSPIWPPRRPFLPYGRPNLALAGILVVCAYILHTRTMSVFTVRFINQSVCLHTVTYVMVVCATVSVCAL